MYVLDYWTHIALKLDPSLCIRVFLLLGLKVWPHKGCRSWIPYCVSEWTLSRLRPIWHWFDHYICHMYIKLWPYIGSMADLYMSGRLIMHVTMCFVTNTYRFLIMHMDLLFIAYFIFYELALGYLEYTLS